MSEGIAAGESYVAPALNLRPKGARMNPREEFERIAEIERAEQEKRGLARYDKALADTRSKTHVARG